MTAVPKKKLTVAEYLAIEEKAEFKSEYWYGEMIPVHRDGVTGMAGASDPHNVIFAILMKQLNRQLPDSCYTFGSDLRVRVEPSGVFAYPDLTVVCGPREYATDDPNSLVNPRVIIEILSPSTERIDRTTKLRRYTRLPPLQEYVLIAQQRPEVFHVFQRGEFWAFEVLIESQEVLSFTSIEARITLADIYRNVEFPPPAPGVPS